MTDKSGGFAFELTGIVGILKKKTSYWYHHITGPPTPAAGPVSTTNAQPPVSSYSLLNGHCTVRGTRPWPLLKLGPMRVLSNRIHLSTIHKECPFP